MANAPDDAAPRNQPHTPTSLLGRLCREPGASDWEKLAALYQPYIQGRLRSLGVPEQDRDDLAQETLLRIHRGLGSFDHRHDGSFAAWLRKIIRNVVLDHWSDGQPSPRGGSDALAQLQQLEDPHCALQYQWDREHDLFVLRQLLERVRPRFGAKVWQAFWQVALENKPAAAVALALGMKRSAVHVAKAKVLRELRREADGWIA